MMPGLSPENPASSIFSAALPGYLDCPFYLKMLTCVHEFHQGRKIYTVA